MFSKPGDGGGQIQLRAEALGNAAVAAHGAVAELADLLVAAALLLPGLDQRAIMVVRKAIGNPGFVQ